MEVILLCIEFFKIGLFAIGGGLATIPFLIDLIGRYGWFSMETLQRMIAISESTPGPIGINMATYVGSHVYGVLGGVLAVLSLVTPSVIIIIIIAKTMKRFKENAYYKHLFVYLKPLSIALLVGVIIQLGSSTLFRTPTTLNLPVVLIVGVGLLLYQKIQVHPIVVLGITMVVGIIIKL